MASIYTTIAKRRVEQSKEPIQTATPTPLSSEKSRSEHSEPTSEQQTSELVNQQTSKLANKQFGNESPKTAIQSDITDEPLDTSHLSSKEKTKYGTYLTDESIEKINIRAIQRKRDAHQIVQEAINQYFERLEK